MQKKSNLILTLDAGGTNFVFSALKGGQLFGDRFTINADVHDIDLCVSSIISGFQKLIYSLPEKPDAISFAFPGPSDYKNGIIGDLPNLPAFRGGIPLGPILEENFGIPVFINNDGDLFALGESKEGFLPYINKLMEQAGNPKRYKNLIGVTLGTGFGVGITIDGRLLEGDNSIAAEGWLLRNKQFNYSSIEDSVSIRAIKRMYAEQISISPANSPEPKDIYEIAKGNKAGVQEAALETYLRFGEALGDAIAHILTLIDGVVVIGGGLSGAYSIFSRSMMDELNGYFTALNGIKYRRLIQHVHNIEQSFSVKEFTSSVQKEILVPNSERKIQYQEKKNTVIGLSRIGTNSAVAVGAYHFAQERLSK
ncbi:MAG: ROK family protein [Balneolaceae bacterium]